MDNSEEKKVRLFTSESVTNGHPDKLCDQIADAILDACLQQDNDAHVASEVLVTNNTIVLAGEITTTANINPVQIARDVATKIGYTSDNVGLDGYNCNVINLITQQSPDINSAVLSSYETREKDDDTVLDVYDRQGAGDQGIIFGYANSETKEYMPFSLMLAHALCKGLETYRTSHTTHLRPDGKSQVTVKYNDNGDLIGIDTVVLSTQHDSDISIEDLREDIIENVIKPVFKEQGVSYEQELKEGMKLLINPSGRFVIGGPEGDTGVTGRKLAVDTYGGYAKLGGGAMSGKDASKVDRSAAYMARYASKNVVASGVAQECEIQVSYAIGSSNPVSINVNTKGTGIIDDKDLSKIVSELFDFRPLAIIDKLQLRKPIFSNTSSYGHFGKDGLPWEEVDFDIVTSIQNKVDEVKSWKE